jgi:hypothetical protein
MFQDRKHAGELRTEHLAGEKIQEENHGKGEKPKDRHRLQDIEQRNQHHLGAPALGGQRRIDEGEHDRADNRQQHPHRRSQRIAWQIGRIERYRRNIERRQGKGSLLAAVDDQHHGADHQNQRDSVPDIGPQRLPQCRRSDIMKGHRRRLVQRRLNLRPARYRRYRQDL